MLKLMKYELNRRYQFIFIIMMFIVFMEFLILFGLIKGDVWFMMSFLSSILLITGTMFAVFFDCIRTHYQDLNNNPGYMLYLTPVNRYKIIGSKMLVNLLEIAFFFILFTALMIINFAVLKKFHIDTSDYFTVNMYDEIMTGLKMVFPSTGYLFLLTITAIIQWLNNIMIAILAITLTKTLLANVKASWAISLIFYIILVTITQFVSMGVLVASGFINDMLSFTEVTEVPDMSGFLIKSVSIGGAMYFIYLSIAFFFTGMLLNKRIDI
jgi:hypothetical protein